MKRFVIFLAVTSLWAATAGPLTPGAEERAALDRISVADMLGNLSFLSSDLLEGRDTPSTGLDIAAEFIASQFRRSGLEPAAPDYFQVADFVEVTPSKEGVELALTSGDTSVRATTDLDLRSYAAIDVKDAPIYKAGKGEMPSLEGKIACLSQPDLRGENGMEKYEAFQASMKAVEAKHPAAILVIVSGGMRRGGQRARLVDAADVKPGTPTVNVRESAAAKFLEGLKEGDTGAAATIHAKAPAEKHVKVRNVAGILRGSDPALANSYVLVTAHYDHIGVLPSGEGDRINNGANDDGSGTVSVIEIANALAGMKTHPRRSIVFMTFFGEEKGLLGSRYYARHPLEPLKDTVAQINLEQVGRTDDTEGPQVGTATFTGFHFSEVPEIFEAAGKATGVKVYNNEEHGDAFFSRSDNQSLADAGIPSHTLAVAFEFPDYHQPGDEWQKIDYENMAKIDRMVALGLIEIANRGEAPHWNEKDKKAEKYIKAWRALHP